MSRTYQQAPGAAGRPRQAAPIGLTESSVRSRSNGPPTYPPSTRKPSVGPEETLQERTVHVGDGFQMFVPSTEKHEKLKEQSEKEQRQYQEHRERMRLRHVHEVNRLGGGAITHDEARKKQEENYRRDKFLRLEKLRREKLKKNGIDTEKATSVGNQISPLQSTDGTAAASWTAEMVEIDRKQTMERFFNRLTNNEPTVDVDSMADEFSEKLKILREMLPTLDDQQLTYYFKIYDGDLDRIANDLLQ